jgi:hypothetical protein
VPTANSYTYPVPAYFSGIEQQYLPIMDFARSPFAEIFPFRMLDKGLVVWEQYDNFYGLMSFRGYNGEPIRVKKTGFKQYSMEPGVYGNFSNVDEKEMTERRRFATVNDPTDLTDLTTLEFRKLLQMRIMRIQWIEAQLVTQGQFVVTNGTGTVVHSDGYQQRTYTATTPWSNYTTATPLGDIRGVQLMHRGYSVRFDSSSTLWMNQKQLNYALNNQNPSDLYGRRVDGLSTINTLALLNKFLAGENLPQIGVYDEGYYDDNQVFNLWIPTGSAFVMGKRTSGAPIGGFCYTRNAVNGGQPGPYSFIKADKLRDVPPECQVHDGFNGGPVLEFPSALVVLTNI